MVAAFSGTSWQLASDPQPGVQDNSTQGSFIPAFGDAMYARYHLPIGVACMATDLPVSGQWLPKGDRIDVPPTMGKFVIQLGPTEWQSTGQLFDTMVDRMKQLGARGFRAVLWHQGESDAHQAPGHDITAAQYRQMMVRVITASRNQAGWDMPWFVAQASYHTPKFRVPAGTRCPPVSGKTASRWTGHRHPHRCQPAE